MKYSSGNIYDGDWNDNVKEGTGKMVWTDLSQTYEGEWKAGAPDGFGIHESNFASLRGHQYPKQNVYTGCFQAGKRHGHGTMQYASGAIYEGSWHENIKHGSGKYISENGRVYIGEFENDHTVEPFTRSANGKQQII